MTKMTENNTGKLEKVAYIAIICMTIFTISLVSYRYFGKTSIPATNKIKKGDFLNRSALELPKSEKMLVLFISENCKFCRESGIFYQKLIKSPSKDKSIGILAVLPNREKNGEDNFEKDGVAFPLKAYADFAELGVIYTPTILLIDKEGKILNLWLGKLNDENEREVLSLLNEN